jgi:mutator protein MutT
MKKGINLDSKGIARFAKGKDYIGVGVGAIIINDKGELFLAKRGPKAKNERGTWEFPGGGIEFGETMADCIKREIFEEYGIKIDLTGQLEAIDHLIPDEKQHWVAITYLAKIVQGTPKIMEVGKCDEIGWFEINRLPKPLSLVSTASLDLLKKYLSK